MTEPETDFGYERLSPAEKTRRVGRVFSSVAGDYDLMNDLMSGGAHRCWKRRLVRLGALKPRDRVLDLAAGPARRGYAGRSDQPPRERRRALFERQRPLARA